MSQKAEQQADPLMTVIGSAQKAVGSLARYIRAAQALEDYILAQVAGPCARADLLRQDAPVCKGWVSASFRYRPYVPDNPEENRIANFTEAKVAIVWGKGSERVLDRSFVNEN